MSAAPELPDIPIITPDRLMQAFLAFISEERTIEEAAVLTNKSDTALRMQIDEHPHFQQSVYEVGKMSSDGKRQLRTNMRMQWVAQDRAGETHAQLAQARQRAARSRRRAA